MEILSEIDFERLINAPQAFRFQRQPDMVFRIPGKLRGFGQGIMRKTEKSRPDRSEAARDGATMVRLPDDLRNRIIKWAERHSDASNISEAACRLIELGLATKAGSRSDRYVWLERECNDRSFTAILRHFDQQYESMARPRRMMLLSLRRADETVAYVRVTETLCLSYPKFRLIDAAAVPAHAEFVAGYRSSR